MIFGNSRALRRELRPLAWVTLEEIALTAFDDGGRWVARTSARQVAEELGIDPGTAANALRTLRRRGLLHLEREQGPAGRFGLSVYVLGKFDELRLAQPGVVRPCVATPVVVDEAVDGSSSKENRPRVVESPVVHVDSASAEPMPQAAMTPSPGTATPSAPPQCPGQESLDFGSVTA